MTLAQVLSLMEQNQIKVLTTAFEKGRPHSNVKWPIYAKQLYPYLHKVLTERKDKVVPVMEDDGSGVLKKTGDKAVMVNKLPLSLQKKIVLFASVFLGNPRIDCNPANDAETNLKQVIDFIGDVNKLEYRFPELMRIVMSETHAAELWYIPPTENESFYSGQPIDSNQPLKLKILANSFGDQLYPLFDEFDDMLAFGRGYKMIELVNGQAQEVEHFDLYTDQNIYYAKSQGQQWLFYDVAIDEYAADFVGVENPIGKIPIIYYEQPTVEWADVQELIERYEFKISNHADTNDYFDSPIVVTKGQIRGFADKGSTGKVLEAEEGGDASYLTWDNAPESMKLEMDNLSYFIHSLTHTPDISFENIKGLGKLSGIALKLLFMDAHIKAAQKEAIFGVGVQRRLNFLKKALGYLDPALNAALNMKMTPVFTYFEPSDTAGDINTLAAAVGADLMSQESAVEQNPLVEDPIQEMERIRTEAADAAAKALNIAKQTAKTPTPLPTPAPGTGNGEENVPPAQ